MVRLQLSKGLFEYKRRAFHSSIHPFSFILLEHHTSFSYLITMHTAVFLDARVGAALAAPQQAVLDTDTPCGPQAAGAGPIPTIDTHKEFIGYGG